MRSFVIFLIATLIAIPAHAAVTYKFTALTGGYNQSGSFSVTFGDFYSPPSSGNQMFQPNISVGSLTSCDVSTSGFGGVPAQPLICSDQLFLSGYPYYWPVEPKHDVVGFGFLSPYTTDGSGNWMRSTFAYYFEEGALSKPGHYKSTGDYWQSGTLDVFQSAVPEPETWTLMIVGFGFIGFAARRNGKSINSTPMFARKATLHSSGIETVSHQPADTF